MLLFLSHSGADTAAAVELKRRILLSPEAQAAGLQVWLDKDELCRGGPNDRVRSQLGRKGMT